MSEKLRNEARRRGAAGVMVMCIRQAGRLSLLRDMSSVSALGLSQLETVCQIGAWPGRQTRSGRWWMSALGHSIEFAIAKERGLSPDSRL